MKGGGMDGWKERGSKGGEGDRKATDKWKDFQQKKHYFSP